MKTFTKVMLMIAGVLGSVGVICMLVAFAMGLSTSHLMDMVEDGQFSFDSDDFHFSIGGDFDSNSKVQIDEECRGMDIEFAAGLLEIYYDDVKTIQVNHSNIPNLKVETKSGILVIQDDSKLNMGVHNTEGRKLEIILPENTSFEEVSLEIGASKAGISDIVTNHFELEVGAGEASIENLSVQELEVEAGVGKVDIEIAGAEKDYNYDLECGIGKIIVGENSWNGIGAKQRITNEGAKKQMHIKCGVGEVNVHFTREEGTEICMNESDYFSDQR